MNKNEIINMVKAQAFDTIVSMVGGKKEADTAVLIQTIQNCSMMVQFQEKAMEDVQ